MRTNRLIMLLVCCFAWLQAVQASETGASVQSGQMTLMGSLETPEGVEKPPVVLIIAGSGPTDRDGNSRMIPGKNNSLRMVAEALSAGIASLRYDKRGVGAACNCRQAGICSLMIMSVMQRPGSTGCNKAESFRASLCSVTAKVH
jgi:hypothetical protein